MSDNTASWQNLADEKRWSEIDIHQLSPTDRHALMETLSFVVPKARRGSGLETYIDFADSFEISDPNLAEAATLLERLCGGGRWSVASYPADWLEEASARAVVALEAFGIDVLDDSGERRALSEVFGYFCPRDQKFVEVQRSLAEALARKQRALEEQALIDSKEGDDSGWERLRAWHNLYPWRNTFPLSRMLYSHRSEWENTKIDHALSLYQLVEICSRMIESEGADYDFMGFAFECGRRHASVFWKGHEAATIRQYENAKQRREAGKKGGQADKKRERYTVLNALAAKNIKKFQYVSDAQAMRSARLLASQHDATSETPLFCVNNKPLSADWFSEWIGEFRRLMASSG